MAQKNAMNIEPIKSRCAKRKASGACRSSSLVWQLSLVKSRFFRHPRKSGASFHGWLNATVFRPAKDRRPTYKQGVNRHFGYGAESIRYSESHANRLWRSKATTISSEDAFY